jgi:L-arabinonolactonase
MNEVKCVVECQNTTGECPAWSIEEQRLYWLDIEKSELWRYDPETGETKVWKTPERAASFAFREKGGLLVAFESCLAFWDPETGKMAKIKDFEPDLATTRTNDGRCDRQGRFIVGGIDESGKFEKISNVYRVGKDSSVHKIISGVACANSICFSPDGRVMYFADSPNREIWAYDYDPHTGDLSNQRIFTEFSDQPGMPDGSIVDSEGYLWNAQWSGHRVVRYRPDGTVERVISVPAKNVTCLAFGGKNLDVLYVTTARFLMTPEQIKSEPLSGGLFAVNVNVKGLIEPKFRG